MANPRDIVGVMCGRGGCHTTAKFVGKRRVIARIALGLIALALTGCARESQRLDLIAMQGQPADRAVIDQRECEAEFPYTRKESTLQAYAACLIARGYISEVPLSASSGTRRITLYVRADRGGRAPSEIRSDITVCEGDVQRAFRRLRAAWRRGAMRSAMNVRTSCRAPDDRRL